MEKKQKIILRYKKKIKLIQKYNQNYFDKNTPIVSDGEYDDLKKEIILLENKHKFLQSNNSPSKSVPNLYNKPMTALELLSSPLVKGSPVIVASPLGEEILSVAI